LYGRSGIERSVNGLALRIHPDYRWFFQEEYDREVADYFGKKVPPGAVCLSIGANIGIYPLQFAKWSGANGVVHAFEPNPTTANMLRRHVEMNDLQSQIHVYEQAVSSSCGTAKFAAAGTDGMSRLGSANPCLHETVSFIDVPLTTIDTFVATLDKKPSVLMMDIEGFEIAAINGGLRFFRETKDLVAVVEFHPNAWHLANTSPDDLRQTLSSLNLRPVPLTGQIDCFYDYGHVAFERA